MSNRDDFERVISLLRDGPIVVPDPDAAQAFRERTLPTLRALVIGTPQRLRRRRQIRGALSLAGIVTCLGVAWLALRLDRHQPLPATFDTVLVEMPRSNQATWTDGIQPPQLLGTRSRLPLRGRLRSLDEKAVTLRTPQGVQVALAEKSEIELGQIAVSADHSVLSLNAGQIRCSVPHLPAGSVFSVRTSDAEVIVHGTVFSVEAPVSAAPTCVRVEEGRVEVRLGGQYRLLEAGGSFGCAVPVTDAAIPDSPQSAASSSSASNPSVKHAAPTSVHARSATASPAQQSPTGTLADESRLLAAALVKEREGQRAQARELFQTLVTRYPQSALAVEARAGLARTRDPEAR